MKRLMFMRRAFANKRLGRRQKRYDAFIIDDLKMATEQAKVFLGVTDEAVNAFNPIAYTVPAEKSDKVNPVLIYGKDKIRYDLASFHVFLFGEETLYYYNALLNHKTRSIFNEKSVELPYIQIQNIETISTFKRIYNIDYHVFQLNLAITEQKDLPLPLRVAMINKRTTKKEFEIDEDLIALSTNLKSFLREKMTF